MQLINSGGAQITRYREAQIVQSNIRQQESYQQQKYIMTTALEATDKDFERMMQMLTSFFVTQIAGAVATYSIADHLASIERPTALCRFGLWNWR
jgi:hypothetical protein